MTYTVLARRYRSTDFDELIGQEPVARTLQNAIRIDRIAHAYLFCGTRGVGKTSMARIFAKALNATEDLAESEGIAAAILRGDDLDVIEIDGASNRGVQQARDLIAGAGLLPTRCRFKIYIIDEVHMLTTEAFNALLKTMEEPPAHVKFILCTTEPHKVPTTIQSRCQRFDFRPVATPQIAEHLTSVLSGEGIEADDDVIRLVARLGNGSVRDALSLLDRLIAAADGRMTSDLAVSLLGLPDQTLVSRLVQAIIDRDLAGALAAGDDMLSRGIGIEQTLDTLTERFRDLLIVSVCGPETMLVDRTDEVVAEIAGQASSFDPPALTHMITLADHVTRNARGSTTARAQFDALIARLCLREHFMDARALLEGEAPTADPSGKKKEAPPRVDKPLTATASPAPTAPAPTAPVPTAPATAAAVEPKPAPARAPSGDLWELVQRHVAGAPADQAHIDPLRFASFDGTTLCLTVDDDNAAAARYLKDQHERIAGIVLAATGQRCTVRIDVPATARAEPSPTTRAGVTEEVLRDPLVQKAIDIFDATVTGVRPRATPERDADGDHDAQESEDVR